MKTIEIPQAGMTAPALVLGLMRIAAKSDDEVRELVRTAREQGIDFIDHADIYGPEPHACERRFAEAMRMTPSERAQLTIQTKAGIVRDGPYFDFSYEHLIETVNGSLQALGTDYIDILLLHRPDALVEPEEVARAFEELHTAGKVRHFGVSNHTPGQIELLKTALTRPIVANQLQLSVPHAALITQGLAANMVGLDQSISRDAGLLDYCRLRGITVQAWSPSHAGFGTGPFVGDRENFAELNDLLDELAERYDVTPNGIATAWITRHPAQMQVVLGTTTPGRVVEAAAGSDVVLTRPEWYGLARAAGHTVP
ncbi:aldo/keto reductase [Pseudactinotalea sp.]|uniref:aldo/keto reductase n=1 Tax=Pseudactinotalea sp. TaxID=1926260 RepID=UPI003B3BBD69